MKPEPLQGKGIQSVLNLCEHSIESDMHDICNKCLARKNWLAGYNFRRDKEKSAVEWLKQHIFCEYNEDKEEILKLIDEAFEDITKKE